MNRSIAIRALIPDADSAKLPRELVAALPQFKAKGIRESLGEMFRQGIVDRIGNRSDGFRYYAARAVKLKAYESDEARREGKRRTDAAANRRKKRPLAEFRAEQARKREATAARRLVEEEARRRALAEKRAAEKAATDAAVAAKRASTRRARMEAEAERRAQRLLTREQRLLNTAPARSAKAVRATLASVADVPAAAIKTPKAESVEEWMARTGQRPQVLDSVWNRRAA